MTNWPNWVDLVVVTLVFTACYKAFVRGFFAELFYLVGIVCVTCLSINYAGDAAGYMQPFLGRVNATLARWLVFWLLFCGLWFVSFLLIRRLTELVKWERIHWTIQGLAMAVGLTRGLWWSAVVLVALGSSGLSYLSESAAERSVLGSRLMASAHELLESTASAFPGAAQRRGELIPPARDVSKAKDKGAR